MCSYKTGGSAFPSHGNMGEVVDAGMSLRDYFAAKAMAAIIAMHDAGDCEYDENLVAINAYKMADALIAERNACNES